MTDAEFLCGWMEPKPAIGTHGGTCRSGGNWWYWNGEWVPRAITLNECHLIEGRLKDEQWSRYECKMLASWNPVVGELGGMVGEVKYYLHADAETKIRALANTLDPGREKRGTV